MRMFADEGELVEKYRRLSDEGRARISRLNVSCALMQRSLPKGRKVSVRVLKPQDITADEAAVKLGISKATLYRMEKRRIKESQTASD